MIEPRIHWLLDLSLVDNNEFLNGRIKPAAFLYNFKEEFSTPEDYEVKKKLMLDGFLEYSSIKKKVIDQKTKIKVVESSIFELKKFYDRMIPIESIIMLSYAQLANLTKLLSKNEIFMILNKNFQVYKDWRTGLGFIDSR